MLDTAWFGVQFEGEENGNCSGRAMLSVVLDLEKKKNVIGVEPMAEWYSKQGLKSKANEAWLLLL